MKKRYIRHASELVTCKGSAPKHGKEMSDIGLIKDGAVIMYGYNFPKNSKIGKSLDFYISSDGDVCRIVLSGEE